MENLRVVAEKLLLIREAANFLYLLSNPEMVSKAEGMALLLAGASANPIVVGGYYRRVEGGAWRTERHRPYDRRLEGSGCTFQGCR